MKETGALLAGETSGHIFFQDSWYGFGDALYAGARLLEILADRGELPVEVFAKLPGGVATPELHLEMPKKQLKTFMQALVNAASFEEGAELSTVDGLRVDFSDGWGLVRASDTASRVVLRFEADGPAALERIQASFRQQLLALDNELELPF